MSNPVCFFDIEIGGQPAGTIEMTVRARERATRASERRRVDDRRERERDADDRARAMHRALTDGSRGFLCT